MMEPVAGEGSSVSVPLESSTAAVLSLLHAVVKAVKAISISAEMGKALLLFIAMMFN